MKIVSHRRDRTYYTYYYEKKWDDILRQYVATHMYQTALQVRLQYTVKLLTYRKAIYVGGKNALRTRRRR
jgi:hypothetical protein